MLKHQSLHFQTPSTPLSGLLQQCLADQANDGRRPDYIVVGLCIQLSPPSLRIPLTHPWQCCTQLSTAEEASVSLSARHLLSSELDMYLHGQPQNATGCSETYEYARQAAETAH